MRLDRSPVWQALPKIVQETLAETSVVGICVKLDIAVFRAATVALRRAYLLRLRVGDEIRSFDLTPRLGGISI